MSCIDAYDAAMDNCHCYFWERKIAAVMILAGLWCGIYFIVINTNFSSNMGIWLGFVVAFFAALFFYGITSESYCGDPFRNCRTEKILPFVVKPVNNDHMYT